MRGRRFAKRSRSERLRRHSLARRPRPGLVTPASGGVGAPPGDTTIPRQELADVDVRSFAVADARLWNGADTVARSPRRLKARNTRTFAKCAARRREPASPLSTGRRGHQGKRRDGAPEGAPAPYGR